MARSKKEKESKKDKQSKSDKKTEKDKSKSSKEKSKLRDSPLKSPVKISRADPPKISRTEPPKISRAEPPKISRAEPSKSSRIDPPASSSAITPQMIPHPWERDYKEGRMANVIKYLTQKGVSSADYLKSGSTCIVFHYKNDQVLKLCTKDIVYFRQYINSTVSDFKDLVCNRFRSYLLPVKEMLYDDSLYFVYTQDKLRILDLPEIDADIYCGILDIVKKMFVEKIITPDIISCNLGFIKNSQGETELLLLDYHDLVPCEVYHKKQKWTKIFNCLLNFASYMIYKKGFEEQFKEPLAGWKEDLKIRKRNFGAEFFPEHITNVFKALATPNNEAVISAITECQRKLQL